MEAESKLLQAALKAGLEKKDAKATIKSGLISGIKKTKQQPQINPMDAIASDFIECFHDYSGAPLVSINTPEGKRTLEVGSDYCEAWLRKKLKSILGKAPIQRKVDEMMSQIRAECMYGNKKDVFRRFGHNSAMLGFDLTDDKNQCVLIYNGDWNIVNNSPIEFVASTAMESAPVPNKVTDTMAALNKLRKVINLPTEEQFILFIGFLIQCFQKRGPYFHLAITGINGSCKTFVQKVIRILLDPRTDKSISMPRSEEGIALAAYSRGIVTIDNISKLSIDQSDWLCRLSTGGGFEKRLNFENTKTRAFDKPTPAILNGIQQYIKRQDLLERCILLELERIPESERKPETELLETLYNDLPDILGGLLNAVAIAHRDVDKVKLAKYPRMADATKWITAAEPELGWKPGTFQNAYKQNLALKADNQIKSDRVATLLLDYCEAQGKTGEIFANSISHLLKCLNSFSPAFAEKKVMANKLSTYVTTAAPMLEAYGISIHQTGSGGGNLSHIVITMD